MTQRSSSAITVEPEIEVPGTQSLSSTSSQTAVTSSKKRKRRAKKSVKDVSEQTSSIIIQETPPKEKKAKTKPVKHPPPKLVKEIKQSSVYISTGTPFVSALKRVSKHIHELQKSGTKSPDKLKDLHVTVYGLGKAIDKALSVALKFKELYRVEIVTGTVDVVDETEEDDEEGMPKMSKRKVSKVEIRIYVWGKGTD